MDDDKTQLNPSIHNQKTAVKTDGGTDEDATRLVPPKAKPPKPKATHPTPKAKPTEPKQTDDDATRLNVSASREDQTKIRPVSEKLSTEAVTRLNTSLRKESKTGTKTASYTNYSANAPEIGVGSIIRERFVLEEVLGTGGMGAVYRAVDLRKREAEDTNPYIAIKLLHGEFKHHHRAFITLQREAKKTQALAHPNIVTVYDFDREGDLVFLTMEELKGHPLKDVLRGKTNIVLTYKKKIQIITEIARGLAYAHSKGIIHSDLKPANLFYTDKETIKILDFGIARAANEEIYQDNFDAGELGALTYPYASLEMIEHLQPHPSDDIYALGIIACEVLGGLHPYNGKDAKYAHEHNMVPVLPKTRNFLLQRFLKQSVALERKNRIDAAQLFIKKLHFANSGPRRINGIAATLLIAALANYFYIQTIETELVPFDTLPAETQSQFFNYLEEGYTALKFDDLQGAVVNFDQAFQIHGTNNDIKKAKKAVYDILEESINKAEDAKQKVFFEEQLEELKLYPAFADTQTGK